MESCKHEVLTLLTIKGNKLRCRHCHLTITEEELAGSGCPECLAVHKVRRNDFEKITAADSGTTRYCCESCGMVIDC
jgi:Zn finger protein HypA/HybF involved in hydrogenase expression